MDDIGSQLNIGGVMEDSDEDEFEDLNLFPMEEIAEICNEVNKLVEDVNKIFSSKADHFQCKIVQRKDLKL